MIMTTRKNKELDLIDRNELNNFVRSYLNHRYSLGETRINDTLTIGEVASIIAAIPTINAKIEEEPLKWEISKTEDQRYRYRCPNCGARHITKRPYHQKYCGNCSRRMEEGEA